MKKSITHHHHYHLLLIVSTYNYSINISLQIHLRWIIGQVQEQTHILHGSILLEVLFEEASCFHINLHITTENNQHARLNQRRL